MKRFLQKSLALGITPANAASWLSLTAMRHVGVMCGTARLYLKAMILGVKIGRFVRAHGPVGLLRWPGGEIVIRDHVSIISSWRRSTAAALTWPTRLRVFGQGARIDLGEGAELNGTSITARSKSITIGRRVMIAPNCIITDSDFHAPWPAERRNIDPGYENDAPVSIGDHVWVGMNSIILKGVNIGSGAIIGAGSVVTRDIPPDAVACGVPCRLIRSGRD